MKNIKRKIFQIILTVFMVFSSCFLTGTVEAASSGVENALNKGMLISRNDVIDDYGFNNDQVPPFAKDGGATGSEQTNGNEGLVWTNKKVENGDEDGQFIITLSTVGYRYREVDNENNRTEQWKNPIEDKTYLEIIEDIENGYSYVDGSMNVTKRIGLDNQKPYNIDNTDNQIKLIFNEEDITPKDDTIAFDVQIQFTVEFTMENPNVSVNYSTGDAVSKFIPAGDNYYYYTWDVQKTSIKLDGINWSNGKGYQFRNGTELKNVTLEGVTFQQSIGIEHTALINNGNDEVKVEINGINYSKFQFDLSTTDLNNLVDFFANSNIYIKDMYIYQATNDVANKQYFTIIEINYVYNDESINVRFAPVYTAGNPGGNNGESVDIVQIIDKSDPVLRDDYVPDQDGNLVKQFDKKGVLAFSMIQESDIKSKKTAHVIDWDDRTYQIDLYAAHNINTNVEPIDLVMMLDFSGSMPWFVNQPTGPIYLKDKIPVNLKGSEVVNKEGDTTIDKWKYNLYVKDVVQEVKGDNGNVIKRFYEYKPIVWVNEGKHDTGGNKDVYLESGWYIVKSSKDGRKVIDADKINSGDDDEKYVSSIDWSLNKNEEGEEIVYSRSDSDMTKLEALQKAVYNFVVRLQALSSESKIAIIPFAGDIIDNDYASDSLQSIKPQDINKLFNSITLQGNTNQHAAMVKAKDIIEKSTSSNKKYAILFSDGVPTYGKKIDDNKSIPDSDTFNKAADELKTICSTFFTAGIFANKTDSAGVTEMTGWATDKNCVYIEDTSNDLIEAFNDIFGRITVQITGVTVKDYIDSRFEVIDAEGNVINISDISEDGIPYNGGTLKKDYDDRMYVEWTNVNLSYAEDVTTGWHKTIYVKAKDEYIGGNNVTTNDEDSGITVGDVTKEFDQPTVNVKVDFVVGNYDEKVFYGESVDLDEVDSKLFETVNNSKGEPLTIAPDGSRLDKGNFTLEWYSSVDVDKSNVINDTKIEENDEIITPQGPESYYLRVQLKVENSDGSSKENTEGHENTIDSTLLAKNDMDVEGKFDDNRLDDSINGKDIDDYANASSQYGVYVVDVVKGNITIHKNILDDTIADPDTQGDSIFTFLIDGTTESGKKIHEYKVLRFENFKSQSFTIDDLEKGIYTITELNTIRYNLINVSENGNNQVFCDKTEKNDGLIFHIGYNTEKKESIQAVHGEGVFTNDLENDENYGDTGVVTNSFEVDANGTVTINKDFHNNKGED